MNRETRNGQIEMNAQENLDWLAFCYVADELDVKQRTEFENRLEHDELARDAVVDAMKQAELLWLAMDQEVGEPTKLAKEIVVSNRRALMRYAAAILTVSAALLMMVFAPTWFASPENATSQALSESETIAVVLAELLEEEGDFEELGFEEPDYEVAENDTEEDEFSDWMYVAMTDLEDGLGGAE